MLQQSFAIPFEMTPQYGLRSIEFLQYIPKANFPFIRSVYVCKFVVSHLNAAL